MRISVVNEIFHRGSFRGKDGSAAYLLQEGRGRLMSLHLPSGDTVSGDTVVAALRRNDVPELLRCAALEWYKFLYDLHAHSVILRTHTVEHGGRTRRLPVVAFWLSPSPSFPEWAYVPSKGWMATIVVSRGVVTYPLTLPHDWADALNACPQIADLCTLAELSGGLPIWM